MLFCVSRARSGGQAQHCSTRLNDNMTPLGIVWNATVRGAPCKDKPTESYKDKTGLKGQVIYQANPHRAAWTRFTHKCLDFLTLPLSRSCCSPTPWFTMKSMPSTQIPGPRDTRRSLSSKLSHAKALLSRQVYLIEVPLGLLSYL